MGIIFYFSGLATTGITPQFLPRFLFFKLLHLGEYIILAFLLFYAFFDLKLSFIWAYLFALSDEFHQSFIPGRTGKFTDTLFDLSGILLGLLLATFFIRKPSKR